MFNILYISHIGYNMIKQHFLFGLLYFKSDVHRYRTTVFAVVWYAVSLVKIETETACLLPSYMSEGVDLKSLTTSHLDITLIK